MFTYAAAWQLPIIGFTSGLATAESLSATHWRVDHDNILRPAAGVGHPYLSARYETYSECQARVHGESVPSASSVAPDTGAFGRLRTSERAAHPAAPVRTAASGCAYSTILFFFWGGLAIPCASSIAVRIKP